jgi:hypothetical protein
MNLTDSGPPSASNSGDRYLLTGPKLREQVIEFDAVGVLRAVEQVRGRVLEVPQVAEGHLQRPPPPRGLRVGRPAGVVALTVVVVDQQPARSGVAAAEQ